MTGIIYGMWLVLALGFGAAVGFVWGRVFTRRHPLPKKEMDALIDEAYRVNARRDFGDIGKMAVDIARLATAIAAKSKTAEDTVVVSNTEPEHALPPELQSFEATNTVSNSSTVKSV